MTTLREFRRIAKLSQAAVAEMLKTTRTQISMAELGQRPLPPHGEEGIVLRK